MLIAAILSAAIVIGLLAGFPLGYMIRNFSGSPSSSDVTLPQKEIK